MKIDALPGAVFLGCVGSVRFDGPGTSTYFEDQAAEQMREPGIFGPA